MAAERFCLGPIGCIICLDGVKNLQPALSSIANLYSVRTLYLNDTDVTDNDLHFVAGPAALTELSLQNTRVTDGGMRQICGLSLLSSLNLSETAITDKGLRDIGTMRYLKRLRLNKTRVGDEEGAHGCEASLNLESLELTKTRVSSRCLHDLECLSSLHILSLGYTGVDKIGLSAIKMRLPSLECIDIATYGEQTIATKVGGVWQKDVLDRRSNRRKHQKVYRRAGDRACGTPAGRSRSGKRSRVSQVGPLGSLLYVLGHSSGCEHLLYVGCLGHRRPRPHRGRRRHDRRGHGRDAPLAIYGGAAVIRSPTAAAAATFWTAAAGKTSSTAATAGTRRKSSMTAIRGHRQDRLLPGKRHRLHRRSHERLRPDRTDSGGRQHGRGDLDLHRPQYQRVLRRVRDLEPRGGCLHQPPRMPSTTAPRSCRAAFRPSTKSLPQSTARRQAALAPFGGILDRIGHVGGAASRRRLVARAGRRRAAGEARDHGSASTNLVMDTTDGFVVDADGNLAVKYEIVGDNAAPFSFGIYQSADGVQPTTLVGTIDVSDSADLTGSSGTGTQHTLTYDGDLAGLDGGQYYLAKLDAYNEVYETTKAGNVSGSLLGIFQSADGSVYVFDDPGSSGSDDVTVSQNSATGDITIAVGPHGEMPATVETFANGSGVTVCTYNGNNTINAAGVTVPLTIYGGSGSDTITGGDGGNTIYGGTAGGNTIHGGNGGDTIYGRGSVTNHIYGGSGDDTIYAGSGGDYIWGYGGNNSIYGGDGNDTINVGDGNNQIYGGAGADTITAGDGNNYIDGGAGDDAITAGDGTDWLYAGAGDDTLTAGNGTDVLYGGTGTDILNGGTGYDDLHAGSSSNQLYGHGVHDILDGDLSQIESWGSGLASVNVQDKGGNTDPNSYNGDYASASGYGGGVADWEFDGITSGQRLGASATATPMAIYATWDPSATPTGGTQWATHAAYEIFNGSTLIDTVPVDQQSSPSLELAESSSHPFQRLGVYSISSSMLHVELVDTEYQAGDMLNADAVVITPLWPTVWIRAGQSDQPYTEKDDWLQLWQAVDIPVEGSGNRVQLQMHAAIDSLYSSIQYPAQAHMSEWHAVLPSVSGIDFWSAASGGTPMSAVDQSGDLINQPFPDNGVYEGTVWGSSDPTASGPALTPITFEVDPNGILVVTSVVAATEDPTAMKYVYPFQHATSHKDEHGNLIPAVISTVKISGGKLTVTISDGPDCAKALVVVIFLAVMTGSGGQTDPPGS